MIQQPQYSNHYVIVEQHTHLCCVFGRVGLCCMFVYVCIYVDKKMGCLGSYYSVGVIYCLLIEFMAKRGAYYTRQFVQGKKFGTILLTGREKGSEKLLW